MSTADNREPAFPSTNDVRVGDYGTAGHPGMSLRDYFAARAMRAQPIFPRSLWQFIRWAFGFSFAASKFSPDDYARLAYEQADAMLKAREA